MESKPPDMFGVKEGRQRLDACLAAANTAWQVRDFVAVRSEYEKMLAMPDVAPQCKSYARLRIAQSHEAEGNAAQAKAVYERIKSHADYPDVHRWEAEECIEEIDRVTRGLGRRDSADSRTQIAPVNPSVEYFVSPEGSDANTGAWAQPFATLTKARDAVRALKKKGLPDGGVAITLQGGVYRTTEPLTLTEEDSGTATSPIVYRAARKNAAVLYGGMRLTGFTPVSEDSVLERLPVEARGRAYQCDLRALGVDDFGELKVRGCGQPPSPPTLEVYFDAEPQTLARWPNEGYVGIKCLVEPGDKETGQLPVIEYLGDRPERWTKAEDPWLFGYFQWLWADATIKIDSINTSAKTLTTATIHERNNQVGMSATAEIIYYAFNLLEELDRPGEWYLDRTQGMLYLYPPSDPAQATIEIGMLSTPMLTMDKVAHVRLEGLVFDLGRFDGITVTDSENCLIAGCTVKRFAGEGITIDGGKENGIYGCDVHTIGRCATKVKGGDRQTLAPGGHLVENCHIRSFGRIDRTYTPGIRLEGVGNRVAHNLMHHCPSSVMRIEGNDHVIEYNEIHNALQESDDQGVMELYFNPTYRGVVFRHNYFHDNGKPGTEGPVCSQAAIRFDDAISGMVVYGNVFVRSANGHFGAVQINSGRDNIIDNNVFADCRHGLSGEWKPWNSVWNLIRQGKTPENFYSDALYVSRYPAVAWMMAEPAVNHAWRNVFYNCGDMLHGANPDKWETLANGVFRDVDPGFVDAGAGDFQLTPDAALFTEIGFKPIPVDEIGLYDDSYRATWPVSSIAVVVPDWRTAERPDIQGDAKLADRWQVFAPLDKGFPLPTGAQMHEAPDRLVVDSRELKPVAVQVKSGNVDLAEVLGGTAAEKTAWLYIPLQSKKGGMNTFGFGADWWLQAWIDGELVCDTTPLGNGAYPPSVMDHMATIDLTPGEHLLVVRFMSGSNSSLFAAGGPVALRQTWADAHWWAE